MRAAIVVTGSELVRGERSDLNGPFLARALLGLGIEPAAIRVVGDRSEDLLPALAAGLEHDLLVVSGGLGPTHDDRTVEALAQVAGRPLQLDSELEAQIAARSGRVAERLGLPASDFAPGVRKQANVPHGAVVVGLAEPTGTAPALVLDLGRCVAVVLPGPPVELRSLWERVLATEPLARLLGAATPLRRRSLRFYGVAESVVGRALAAAGGDGDGVEVTICARESEIHVDLLVAPGAEERAAALEEAFLAPIREHLYGSGPIEEIVLDLLRARGLTVATAESCTGGLVGARLTAVPGASDVLLGGVIAYANAVKTALLDVSPDLLARHGAVSAEVASAMAAGARRRVGADVAVAVTGIAGPGGGTADKPVGLVHLCVAGPGGEQAVELNLPGDRETVRGRATVAALHLVRRFVTEL